MFVGIGGLRRIGAGRRDDESVVGMNEPGLINGVIAGAGPPGGVASRRSVALGVIGVGAGWSRVIQQVGDGGLASTTRSVPDSSLNQDEISI